MVLSNDPQMVILRIYNDKAMVVKVNLEDRTVERHFFIVDVAQGLDESYCMKEIGPLTIASEE